MADRRRASRAQQALEVVTAAMERAPQNARAPATRRDGVGIVAQPSARVVATVASRALKVRPQRRQASDVALATPVLPPDELAADYSTLAEAVAWPPPGRVTSTVWFDHTDLAHYFSNNRMPTGIQRVEIELYRAARRRVRAEDGPQAGACAFDIERRCWVALPHATFDVLCGVVADGATSTDELDQAGWDAAVIALNAAVMEAPAVPFRRHDVLVTVGASWWIPDYLTFVRHLQHERGVLYAPFVHDCIPLVRSETCAAGLVVDFRDWFAAAMHAADLVLANSRCTAQDVVTCAGANGLPLPAPHVVRLDAHAGVSAPADTPAGGGLTHARLGIRNRFVLFVATIEARKDHIFVFRCWQELIARYGADAVPDLLCVGKPGWLVEFTMNWLQVNGHVGNKVRMLGTVSDEDLAGLYATAEFCVYNSHYEGWGLPLTESLCHGRVPLAPHHSSLPEAGGPFAAYFEPGSAESFLEQVRRLLDPDERAGRERRIRTRFRPRPWSAVLEQIIATASRAPIRVRTGATGIPLEAGAIYSFGRRSVATRVALSRGGTPLVSGALARFGIGWWKPEEWGCWTRLKHADLLFCLAPQHAGAGSLTRERTIADRRHGTIQDTGPRALRPHMIFLVLRGGPAAQRVEIRAGSLRLGPITVDANRRQLLRLALNDVVSTSGDVLISFTAEPYALADHTGGLDPREIGFGLEALAVIAAGDAEARADITEMAMLPT
jgi:glycosyltransferase involved in cell wall biosynthesis